jgi:UDP-N-acetylmuramoyl-L-alanyl-D-glutamate--2,6-diaminopimelate ligase
VAVFHQPQQDHLGLHGTLDEYARAKRRLFEQLAASPKPHATRVVNADDASGAEMVRDLACLTLTFGLGAGAARARRSSTPRRSTASA